MVSIFNSAEPSKHYEALNRIGWIHLISICSRIYFYTKLYHLGIELFYYKTNSLFEILFFLERFEIFFYNNKGHPIARWIRSSILFFIKYKIKKLISNNELKQKLKKIQRLKSINDSYFNYSEDHKRFPDDLKTNHKLHWNILQHQIQLR